MKQMHHVLVVDDDHGIAELLCGYLARFGLQAHAAANGTEMRRVLARQAIDLVVMDLQLPGEDGLALTTELRRQPLTQRIPVLMLTARGSPIDRVIGLEMGADDYLCKPFEPRELVARIQTVLRRTRGHVLAQQHGSAEAEKRELLVQYAKTLKKSGVANSVIAESLGLPIGVVEKL